MKPEFKIKREILRAAESSEEGYFGPLDTVEQIEGAYNTLVDADAHWDYEEDFRSGEVDTNIPCPSDRNYESKSVAMKTTEGDWIGWTFWSGGGKHGEPGSVDWMGEAYDLTCYEEEKLVLVRTFKLKDNEGGE